MGSETQITIRDGGRTTGGGDARMGLVDLCSGIADGSISELTRLNFETALKRGPALLQARHYFASGGKRLVVCGVNQTDATGGTMTTPVLSGTGLATATSVVTEKPLLGRYYQLEITRVRDGAGRPGSAYATLKVKTVGTTAWADVGGITGLLLDITSTGKTRIYVEQIANGGPNISADGEGPYIELTEDGVAPDDSFVVGDIWTWDATAVAATSARLLTAIEDLHLWEDTLGQRVGGDLGNTIGIGVPMADGDWDDINGIAQDTYDSETDQTFGVFLAAPPLSESGETTVQDSVDRVSADAQAYVAGLVTRDEKPWTALLWAYASNSDGQGNDDVLPQLGEAMALMSLDGGQIGRSIGWQDDSRKLRRMLAIEPDGLTKAQVQHLRDDRRVICLEKVRGRGYWFDSSGLPAPQTSRLTRLQYLRSVNYAATLTHKINSRYKNAPGTTNADLANQQAVAQAEFDRLVGEGVWEQATITYDGVVDPEADPVVIAVTLVVQPVGSREAFAVNLFLTLGGE